MVVLYEVDPSNYGLIYVGRFSRPDNYAKNHRILPEEEGSVQ